MLLPKLASVALAAAHVASCVPTGDAENVAMTKRDTQLSFDPNSKVRGINIGGWLVLEPYITPSIFAALDQSLGIVDEYTLGKQLGDGSSINSKAGQILQQHWSTWITEEDFVNIAQAGFNTVRLPVGYWAFVREDNDPYIQGAGDYWLAALGWAKANNLQVWVDLHGAPGSQNGFDNSGQRTNTIQFQHFNNTDNTLNVIDTMVDSIMSHGFGDVVVAFEILNEPFSPWLDMNQLNDFYHQAYGKVRKYDANMLVVIHDAFQNVSYWNGKLSASDNGAERVLVDHHEYQVFDPTLVNLTHVLHQEAVCQRTWGYTGSDKWVVVGEWSAAQTDCAPHLNGWGTGSRYNGTYKDPTSGQVTNGYTGSCLPTYDISTWDSSLKDDTRRYIEAQIQIYERTTNGWIFWAWKTESAPEWDAQKLIQYGVFPQNTNDSADEGPFGTTQYGMIC